MRLIVTIFCADEVRRAKSRFSRPIILRVFPHNRRQADIADADEGKRASAAAVIRVLSPRTADAIQTINRGRGRGDAQLRRGVAEALDMRLRLRRNSRLPIMAIAVSKSGQDVGKPEKSAIGQTRAA